MTDYIFAESPAAPGAPLLLLLHGTGGNEHQFLELGPTLLPGAHLVAPRGDVSEDGANRYFRRTGEGVYDMADFARATTKMAAFIRHHIAATKPRFVAALGYSNGANILAGLLFDAPELVDRAVLMHPLIPFDPPPQPDLAGRAILITAGRRDSISPPPLSERLGAYFTKSGAKTNLVWHEGGHEIRKSEIDEAAAFLSA